MVVIVTNDVGDRFRGFLASVMLEIAPGVYTSPTMTAGIRERVWNVLEEWYLSLGGGSIVMTWSDKTEPGHQGLRTLGVPARKFVELDGMFVTCAEATSEKSESLEILERLGSHELPSTEEDELGQ